MRFAGVDYWAVVIAGIVGYAAGALWYWGWSKPWMEAQGFTPESMKANQSPVPYLLAFAANLLMAWMLAGVIGHLGIDAVTFRNGVISAAAVWLGFVATTQTVNYSFGKRPLKLLLIDSGHWLVVLLLQGAVIGLMGVS
jgi:uncharacterized protein DUF1761